MSHPVYSQPPSPGQPPIGFQQPHGHVPEKKSNTGKILLMIFIPLSVIGLLCIGLMIALLLPAVNMARHAARRVSSQNQLKVVGLALYEYEASHDQFPYSSGELDAGGKPLLSWRVHILPYLGHEELYRRFHLDEPWDSDHNIKLVKEMPEEYRVPAVETSEGSTVIRAISKPDGMMPYGPGVKLSRIQDGASNTVFTVIANQQSEVPWTSPEPFDNRMSSLHVFPTQLFTVGFADGAVESVPAPQPQDVWEAVTGYADGIPKSFQRRY